MANHKRGRSKNQRAGCLMCKPNKMNGARKDVVGHTGFGKIRDEIVAREDLHDAKLHDIQENEMEYKINYGTTEQPINILAVENKYGSKYIGDFCLKTVGGGWSESPCAIFYQPSPNTSLGHTHYFGIFVRDDSLYITKGDSAFSQPIQGKVGEDGEVIYSRYRHDFRTLSTDKDVFIDGGRDYVRCSVAGQGVTLAIQEDKLVVVAPEDFDKIWPNLEDDEDE